MPDYDDLARKTLRVEESCASACVRAMKCLFEENWLLWEPQTLWIELDHQKVDVPVGNRAQIMAARNLITTGRFWYDAHAYAATCIAFNNEEPLHAGVEEAPVMYQNWAVFEAEKIFRDYEDMATLPEFDREPMIYAAVQLDREGMVLAPEHLKWAEDKLHRMQHPELAELQKTVREGWASAPKGKELLDAAFPETRAGVQLARLAACQIYFNKRAEDRDKQMAPLKC